MKEKILEKLWLTPDESKIYLFLIKNPSKNISDISIKLWINRPKLYKILPSMEENWIISKVIIWKRKCFIAEDPLILNSYFENIKSDFKLFIPELQSIYQNNFKKPIFKHLSWRSGVKNVFLDIANSLNKWDIFYRYSSRKTNMSENQYSKYKKIRDNKQLERMVITNDYLRNIKKEKLEKEVVIVPKDFDIFEDNIVKIIYANKVAIIDYNTEECFIIESQIFSNFEKKLFKLLFRFLKNN